MNSLDNLYVSAVKTAKENEEFTGGFDIMQRLFRKQHEEQQKKDKEAIFTPMEENPPRERYPEEKDEE
jgi:hypothetical protein